jgi:phosphoribosylanthranilate isomerase
MTKVKVCGIRSYEDALMCCEEGVDALGFVHAPGRKRNLEISDIHNIVSLLPQETSSTLICLDKNVEEVLSKARTVSPDNIQTYSLGPEAIMKLKEQGFGVVRAVSVDSVSGRPEVDEDQLAEISKAADLVLFEPSLNGRSGGLGLRFGYREILPFLINKCHRFGIGGGLDPDNVEEALSLKPELVDVSSGVESPDGRKDRLLVREFVRRCKQ